MNNEINKDIEQKADNAKVEEPQESLKEAIAKQAIE